MNLHNKNLLETTRGKLVLTQLNRDPLFLMIYFHWKKEIVTHKHQ